MADTYTVTRTTSIDAPPERVFGLVQDFREWPRWSPWEDLDPELRRTYSGPPAGVGSVYEWAGNRKAGEGRMEVTGVTAPTEVRVDVRFLKPFKSRTESVFAIEPAGTGSRVTWTMHGPLSRMMKVFTRFKPMDSLIGPDFERGLSRLKTTAEQA
jgi:uncharacterized protein YndB with AHSA1/START domain